MPGDEQQVDVLEQRIRREGRIVAHEHAGDARHVRRAVAHKPFAMRGERPLDVVAKRSHAHMMAVDVFAFGGRREHVRERAAERGCAFVVGQPRARGGRHGECELARGRIGVDRSRRKP